METETELLNSVMPMITAEAVKMARKYANLPAIDLADVRQEMSISALNSIRTYTPGKSSIHTYVYHGLAFARTRIRTQVKDYTGETQDTLRGTAPKVCPDCGSKLQYGNCECGYSHAPHALQITLYNQYPSQQYVCDDQKMDLGIGGMDVEYRLFSEAANWSDDEQQLLHALYTGDANFQDQQCRPYAESVRNYYGWSRERAQTALNNLRSNCTEVLGC